MHIKLGDRKVNLIEFNTYEERLKYINTHLFSPEDCQKYFGVKPLNGDFIKMSDKEMDDISDRWMGVKPVGKDKVENVKNVLNIVAGYLLGANETSAKPTIKEFKKLINLKKTDEISERLNYLIYSESLYHEIVIKKKRRYDNLFYINKKEEAFLQNRYQDLQNKESLSNDEKFIFDNIARRIKEIEEVKNRVRNYVSEIVENDYRIDRIKNIIKKIYTNSITKNDWIENKNTILELSSEMRFLDKEIKRLKHDILEEYDTYFILTEYIQKHN